MYEIIFQNTVSLKPSGTWHETTRKPIQPSITQNASIQLVSLISTTTSPTTKTSTTIIQIISPTQQHSLTEEENTISSETSQNDILDGSIDKPKRYTLSASKSAGMIIENVMPETKNS